MKHAIKTLSLLLAVLFLFCFITGCNNSNKPSTNNNPAPSPTPISRIGEETLQWTGQTEEFKYRVYETYVEITEYLLSSETVTIPETIENLPVKSIGASCFSEYMREKSIKEVAMPDTIVNIGHSAFAECEKLEKIEFSSNLQTIDAFAFEDCISLKTLTLPKSINDISIYAFEDLNLKDITFYVYKASYALEFIDKRTSNYEIIDK